MLDDQFASVAEKHASRPPPTPELDEGFWRVWDEKNRAKDRVRAARRKRVLVLLSAAVLVGLALIRLYAGR